jgi:hypothetical protein
MSTVTTPDQITRCIVARIIDGGNTQVVEETPHAGHVSSVRPHVSRMGRLTGSIGQRRRTSRRQIPFGRVVADIPERDRSLHGRAQ